MTDARFARSAKALLDFLSRDHGFEIVAETPLGVPVQHIRYRNDHWEIELRCSHALKTLDITLLQLPQAPAGQPIRLSALRTPLIARLPADEVRRNAQFFQWFSPEGPLERELLRDAATLRLCMRHAHTLAQALRSVSNPAPMPVQPPFWRSPGFLKVAGQVALFGLFITFVVFMNSMAPECHEYTVEKYLPDEVDDIVVRKYRQKMNHNAPAIQFAFSGKMNLFYFAGDLYNAIQIGDTMRKKAGSYDYYLHRKDTVVVVNVECPS